MTNRNENEPLRFSNYFDVDEADLASYGAVNISLINDLPLFIDPFLLFGSDKEEYKAIHHDIICYLLFLKNEAQRIKTPHGGMLQSWYVFPEIKQTWLGFSESGNKGRGLGTDFARGLHEGLQTIFRDFGDETMLDSPHMEKLSLIRPNIGKDKISDFTTNFAMPYLLDYTERFAAQYIDPSKLGKITVARAKFDYDHKHWMPDQRMLPVFDGDYVLLTPKDMLTRSDTFINRNDMIAYASEYATSIGDEALRFQFEMFLRDILSDNDAKKSEKDKAVATFITNNPEIVNYYIKFKEEHKDQAKTKSEIEVLRVNRFFNDAAIAISKTLNASTDFYSSRPFSFFEAKRRVLFLKDAIENKDVYRLLWMNGERPSREADVQLLFKLVWEGSSFDLNREPNNGRGPVDYTVSKGSMDKSIVEFKLASNSKLKHNLQKQVDIYKAANKTDFGITVIIFYTEKEQKKVEDLLNELGLAGNEQIVTIDARRDNKVSASNVRAE